MGPRPALFYDVGDGDDEEECFTSVPGHSFVRQQTMCVMSSEWRRDVNVLWRTG